jgi:large subunit ribosomal protein L9
VQVILREEVLNLGTIGDIVEVKPGYARNYLLPRGLAIEASTRNVRELEHQKRVVAGKRLREQKTASAVAERLGAQTLTFTMRAGEEGKLFGSVTNQDIQRQLEERGFALDRRRILLHDPIKSLGDHKVTIHVGPDTRATVTVTVRAFEEEPATAPAAADEPGAAQ